MSQRERVVWVVMHYEIMGVPDAVRVDAMQYHVSSTLAKAEGYIRGTRADPHSWWQIHPHTVDTSDHAEGGEVHFYSHRGTRLKAAPIQRAVAAFRRYAARNPEYYTPRPPNQG